MTKTRMNKPASTIKGAKRTVEALPPATQSHHANAESASPAPEALSTATKPVSKQQQLAALVVRDEGATLEQMIAMTGWLPHTARAALTGLRKKGYVLSSDRVDGVRTYRAVAPE
jgi:hypothetical protein